MAWPANVTEMEVPYLNFTQLFNNGGSNTTVDLTTMSELSTTSLNPTQVATEPSSVTDMMLVPTTVVAALTVGPYRHQILPVALWVTFQVTETVLTVLALAINCLSLGVIHGVLMRLTPPLQILSSLSFADMLAPWGVMCVYFAASECQEEIHTALLFMAHNAMSMSLLTLSIIHSVATFRPLQYDRVVSKRRVWIAINFIWISSLLTAHIHFLATLSHRHSDIPYCTQVRQNTALPLILSGTISAVTLLVTICVYGRLFIYLRPIVAITEQCQPRKTTKGVKTGMLLVATYIVAWVPYLGTVLHQTLQGNGPLTLDVVIGLHVCQMLILVNSILHPIIYGVRMTNLALGYIRLVQRMRSYAAVSWQRLRGEADEDHPSTPLNPIESIC